MGAGFSQLQFRDVLHLQICSLLKWVLLLCCHLNSTCICSVSGEWFLLLTTIKAVFMWLFFPFFLSVSLVFLTSVLHFAVLGGVRARPKCPTQRYLYFPCSFFPQNLFLPIGPLSVYFHLSCIPQCIQLFLSGIEQLFIDYKVVKI